MQVPSFGNNAEAAKQVECVVRQFFAGEGDALEDVATRVSGPEPVGALEDRLPLLSTPIWTTSFATRRLRSSSLIGM